mmetsp:Transcript_30997/g.74915  ORF Transcript_30997/g.74915 Transcript_30997/m.74915 type:complete len:236 (+) Transcript_30997:705-1412(+)
MGRWLFPKGYAISTCSVDIPRGLWCVCSARVNDTAGSVFLPSLIGESPSPPFSAASIICDSNALSVSSVSSCEYISVICWSFIVTFFPALHLVAHFPLRLGLSSAPLVNRSVFLSATAFALASRILFCVNTGGSASAARFVLWNSFRVRFALGVASNSLTRVMTVSPQIFRTFVTSWWCRSNPCARDAIRRAAAHIPAGRRPATIQSRFMRETRRNAVMDTSLAFSSKLRWAAKR